VRIRQKENFPDIDFLTPAVSLETELRNMVNDVDQNDNGMIEFNEFLQMMSKKMREGDSEDELKEAFK
jgi:Ca2+-binding EF-hand superfamily protein